MARIARASKVTSHLPIQDGRRPAGGWSEEDHRHRENAEGEAERGDRRKCYDKGLQGGGREEVQRSDRSAVSDFRWQDNEGSRDPRNSQHQGWFSSAFGY